MLFQCTQFKNDFVIADEYSWELRFLQYLKEKLLKTIIIVGKL